MKGSGGIKSGGGAKLGGGRGKLGGRAKKPGLPKRNPLRSGKTKATKETSLPSRNPKRAIKSPERNPARAVKDTPTNGGKKVADGIKNWGKQDSGGEQTKVMSSSEASRLVDALSTSAGDAKKSSNPVTSPTKHEVAGKVESGGEKVKGGLQKASLAQDLYNAGEACYNNGLFSGECANSLGTLGANTVSAAGDAMKSPAGKVISRAGGFVGGALDAGNDIHQGTTNGDKVKTGMGMAKGVATGMAMVPGLQTPAALLYGTATAIDNREFLGEVFAPRPEAFDNAILGA